jgi:hypothetical protein
MTSLPYTDDKFLVWCFVFEILCKVLFQLYVSSTHEPLQKYKITFPHHVLAHPVFVISSTPHSFNILTVLGDLCIANFHQAFSLRSYPEILNCDS